jgi:hypothetical protein
LTKEEQLSTLRRLARDQSFIDFLGNKFGNFKRFGIEGVNSATTGLGQLVESAAQMGVAKYSGRNGSSRKIKYSSLCFLKTSTDHLQIILGENT